MLHTIVGLVPVLGTPLKGVLTVVQVIVDFIV